MAAEAAPFRVPAEAYDRFIGRYAPELARELIARAGVEHGQRVLDVGCGPGALTSELVRICGGGSIAAVDPSEPFVAACRERAPGAAVRLAAGEQLPFEDASFDVSLSQLVVNFMADAERGVREMSRVTRAGGTVAAAVWDYAGEMTLLRSFWDAATALDPERGGALDEARSMRFCAPGELEELWRSAGLAQVSGGGIVVTASYEDYDSLWQPFRQGVGPAGAYVAELDEDRRASLREELRERLGSPAGSFELTARAWYVRGVVEPTG